MKEFDGVRWDEVGCERLTTGSWKSGRVRWTGRGTCFVDQTKPQEKKTTGEKNVSSRSWSIN